MKRFLHIGLNVVGQPTVKELEALFNKEPDGDWMRYAQNCWVVWTSQTSEALTDAIHALNPAARFVIFEIKLGTRWGRNDKWVWDWIDNTDKHR